jgi:CO dehydrogenase maturation factor
VKLALVCKGGSGKTTIAGLLARSLAVEGWKVIALDCDANPNLGISLGLGIEATEQLAAIRQALEKEGVEHAPDVEELLVRFGAEGPDGVRLAVVTQIDRPNPG